MEVVVGLGVGGCREEVVGVGVVACPIVIAMSCLG